MPLILGKRGKARCHSIKLEYNINEYTRSFLKILFNYYLFLTYILFDGTVNSVDPLTSWPAKVSSHPSRKLEIGPIQMYPFRDPIGFLLSLTHTYRTMPVHFGELVGLLIAANSTDAVHFSCSIAGEMRTIGPDRCVDGEIEDGVITYRSWSAFTPLLIPLYETRRSRLKQWSDNL